MFGQSGQPSIPSGTFVFPVPSLSGQALRIGETTSVDPRSSGVARPVGSVLYTVNGQTAYLKTGTGNTDWTLIGSSTGNAPLTVVLADGTTTTQPDVLVLRHTTSGVAAAGYGETIAFELESAGGTTRRVMTGVVALVTATDAAEEARFTLGMMVAGSPQTWGALGYRVGGNFPALFFGPAADDTTIGRVNATLQVTVGSTLAQQWTAVAVTSNLKHVFAARAEEAQGLAVASGSTVTLGADGNYFHITGVTTINHITTTNWQAGSRIELYFDSALTVTHNAGAPPGGTNPIRLVGAVNLAAAAGSKLTLRLDSTLSQWVEVSRSGA